MRASTRFERAKLQRLYAKRTCIRERFREVGEYSIVARDSERTLRLRYVLFAAVAAVVVAGVVAWVLNGRAVNHWLGVATGATNEPGAFYGFWSGFGSDIAELGVLGAIATAAYQLVRKYNCHEPRCWRVGTHPAAGGQFVLCYRHHPDYHGKKPTHDLIARMHREHLKRQAAVHDKLSEVLHPHVVADPSRDASWPTSNNGRVSNTS